MTVMNFTIPSFVQLFSCFLNRKFISWVIFEEEGNIKRNMITQLHTTSKEKVQRCFNQWKTRWNKGVGCQGN